MSARRDVRSAGLDRAGPGRMGWDEGAGAKAPLATPRDPCAHTEIGVVACRSCGVGGNDVLYGWAPGEYRLKNGVPPGLRFATQLAERSDSPHKKTGTPSAHMESLVPLASHPAVRAAQDALRAARYAAFEAAFTDPHLVRHPSIASGMFRRAVRVVWHDGWWVTDLVRRPPYFTVEEWSKERDCWENAKIAGFTWAEAKIIAEHIERTRPE